MLFGQLITSSTNLFDTAEDTYHMHGLKKGKAEQCSPIKEWLTLKGFQQYLNSHCSSV